MDTKEIFSKRLLELRESRELSRQNAADSLQISRASLEYYEKGLRLPDVCVLAKIADFYDVSADYLLGRSDVMNIDADRQINAACHYTGLSEESAIILHQANNSVDYKRLSELISEFIVKLVNLKHFPLEYLKATMDIFIDCGKIEKASDYESLYLHEIASKHGYCLFGVKEVTEYWKTKLAFLVSSTAKETFEEIWENTFEEKEREDNGEHNPPKE